MCVFFSLCTRSFSRCTTLAPRKRRGAAFLSSRLTLATRRASPWFQRDRSASRRSQAAWKVRSPIVGGEQSVWKGGEKKTKKTLFFRRPVSSLGKRNQIKHSFPFGLKVSKTSRRMHHLIFFSLPVFPLKRNIFFFMLQM